LLSVSEVVMPAGAILAIIIVCVLVAAAAGTAAALEVRRALTRHQFGREYDRLAGTVGHRRARAEFVKRQRRVSELGIRSLDPGVRQELASSWMSAQESFVDDPPRAVTAASGLVLRAALERGYPVDDREQLLTDLSVHHGRRLDAYRRADKTAAALASAPAPTEELRKALLSYRGLFRELAESPEPARSRRKARTKRAPLVAAPCKPRLARSRAWASLKAARRGIRRPASRVAGQAEDPGRAKPRPRGMLRRLTPASRRTPRPPQREGANQA
jgi:hypothetical protein